MIILETLVDQENSGETDLWSWRSKQVKPIIYEDDNFNITSMLLVCLSCLVLYLCIKLYRQRMKPKKRKPRIKRLLSIVNCGRSPSV